jgi:hypothetical protein
VAGEGGDRAEDQRFFEHAGYDLAEMAAAWSSELPAGGGERRRGASTISQQLAKLLYTGDERSAARKVRELLYAVELDRTLGKARCCSSISRSRPGATASAAAKRRRCTTSASTPPRSTAAEAVWLASLLRNPRPSSSAPRTTATPPGWRRSPARSGRWRARVAKTCSTSSKAGTRRRS